MSSNPTPRLILATLLPYLNVAAAYAREIQPRIAALTGKESAENFFCPFLISG